jgi:hypothetical protein
MGSPFGSGFILDARVERTTTTHVIKNVPPIITLTLFVALAIYPGLELLAAAMAENTSGAPFPKARSVTPARESLQPNLVVIVSRDGDKYISAVEAKLYIAINIKSRPIGEKAITIPVSPNAWWKSQ